MSTYFETGHLKNVANLLKYNQFVTTLGVTYNPSIPSIVLSALVAMQTTAQTKLDTVKTAEDNWKFESNNREIAFKALDAFSTQLLATLKSTDANQQTIDDFVFLVKKLRGDYSGKLTKADAGKMANPSNIPIEVPPTKSSSQQSFDKKIEHFSKMVLLLQGVPSYTPNEAVLQVATLQTQLANLVTLNNTATNSVANLKAARIDRNTYFYAPNTGMLDVIRKSKAYIGGVYGKSSQQYKTALSYKFVRVVPKKNAN
jgi:hypothetical protein